MNFNSYALAIIVAALFTLANALTKYSLMEGKEWVRFVPLGVAVLAFTAFRWLCKLHGLAIASAYVDSMLTIMTLVVAIFFFREQLTVVQYVGIVCLVLGLYLIR